MALIGIDWGSSSFRAYRYGPDGSVVDSITDDKGILRVLDKKFEKALFKLLQASLEVNDTLLFSGMITSRNGWIETPYVEVPADIHTCLSKAVRKTMRDIDMIFLPGVCQQTPPDVIRGEELQIFGVCSETDDGLVLLPGTHSKWVQVVRGAITGFQTTMTGEVYDLLLKQSLVGLIAEGDEYEEPAFLRGVEQGAETGVKSGTVLAKIFTARSGMLLQQHRATEVASYLSGVLIGSEVANALRALPDRSLQVTIVGTHLLCTRYARCLEALGCRNYSIVDDAAVKGFSRMALQLTG